MTKTRYSEIPPQMLQNTILDIGAGTGKLQLSCTNTENFIRASAEGRYVGIDKYQLHDGPLNIQVGDLWEYDGTADTVICFHVIEHFEFEEWPVLFTKLKSFVKDGGWLILGAPWFESSRLFRDMDPDFWATHKVFHITSDTLLPFLGPVICYSGYNNYPVRVSPRKLIWWLRCFLRGDRQVPFGLMRISFVTFWKKED